MRGCGAGPAGRGRAVPAGGRRVRGAGAGLSGTCAPRAGRRRRPEGGEGEVRAGPAPPPLAGAPAEWGAGEPPLHPGPCRGVPSRVTLLGCGHLPGRSRGAGWDPPQGLASAEPGPGEQGGVAPGVPAPLLVPAHRCWRPARAGRPRCRGVQPLNSSQRGQRCQGCVTAAVSVLTCRLCSSPT